MVVVFLCNVGERVDKHEFGHDFRERVSTHHLGIGFVYLGIAVVEVGIVGSLVHSLLIFLHALEIFEIVGVLHSEPVFRVGKIAEDELSILFGIGRLAHAHVHEVHIVVGVEAVDVVGVFAVEAVELRNRSREILKFVL